MEMNHQEQVQSSIPARDNETRNLLIVVSKHIISIVLLMFLILNWVGQGEYAKYYFKDHQFSNYYFLCYMTNSSLIVCYPIYCILHVLFRISRYSIQWIQSHFGNHGLEKNDDHDSRIESDSNEKEKIRSEQHHQHIINYQIQEIDTDYQNTFEEQTPILNHHSTKDHELHHLKDAQEQQDVEMSFSKDWKKFLIGAFFLSPLQLFSNYTWFMSLGMIPVSINMSVYQSLAIFAFLLSICFLKEKVKWYKLLTFCICIIGVIMLGFGGDPTPVVVAQVTPQASSAIQRTNYKSNEIVSSFTQGILLVLLSSFLCALYEVLYSKFFCNISLQNVTLLQSIMGSYVLLIYWILIVILHFSGVEDFTQLWNNSLALDHQRLNDSIIFLLINMFLVVSYYCLILIMLNYTSPNYVNFVSMIVIPVSGIADYLLHGTLYSMVTIIGMSLIFIGSLTVNISSILVDILQRKKSNGHSQ